MYSFRSRVRFSECDTDGKLAFTALLNYFQDCSTQQSEDLGIGVKALHERGTMWVVNSWQIDILRHPKLGDEVETGTLPYDIRGFFGKRNFFMKDADGEFWQLLIPCGHIFPRIRILRKGFPMIYLKNTSRKKGLIWNIREERSIIRKTEKVP